MSQGAGGPGGPTKASQLAELVACERELAEQFAVAEAEGRRLVEKARAAAAAAAADLEASLEADAERVRCEIREAAQSQIRELQATARERAAFFDRVPDDEVVRVADLGFRSLFTSEVTS